jgi:hypothetical protein
MVPFTHYPNFAAQRKFADSEDLTYLDYYVCDEENLHLS